LRRSDFPKGSRSERTQGAGARSGPNQLPRTHGRVELVQYALSSAGATLTISGCWGNGRPIWKTAHGGTNGAPIVVFYFCAQNFRQVGDECVKRLRTRGHHLTTAGPDQRTPRTRDLQLASLLRCFLLKPLGEKVRSFRYRFKLACNSIFRQRPLLAENDVCGDLVFSMF